MSHRGMQYCHICDSTYLSCNNGFKNKLNQSNETKAKLPMILYKNHFPIEMKKTKTTKDHLPLHILNLYMYVNIF